jgi:N-sulfoglucosamine sulfohydrolase
MKRHNALRTVGLLTIGLILGFVSTADAAKRVNILFVSVDDMSCDSVGAYGCKLPDTTPNIDKLAAQGLKFNFAHVQVGNCMPSRNVMFSGRYPHNNRVEGFYQIKDPGYPVLCDLMKKGGYFTAIRGKISHSTPYHPYAWDLAIDVDEQGAKIHPKNVLSYYESTVKGIAASKEAGKPFCFLVNISDPHKPFYFSKTLGSPKNDPNAPSHVFTPKEVPVPGSILPGQRTIQGVCVLWCQTAVFANGSGMP